MISSKYPFLVPLSIVLEKFSFTELLTNDNNYLKEAKKRVKAVLSNADLEPYRKLSEPVIVFYLSVCLVIPEDDLLKLSFIEKEAKVFEKELLKESDEFLAKEIAKHIFDAKVNVESLVADQIINGRIQKSQFDFYMSLNDFLRVLRETRRSEELYSQGVKIVQSKVYLTREKLIRILSYKIKDKLYDMIYGDKLGEIKANCLMLRSGS